MYMRNLSFFGCKIASKYFLTTIITLICSIISGIVLYKCANISIYFQEYTQNYVYLIFNFQNIDLIFPHILSELFYIYLFFLIGYFTKFKYLTLILVFIRGLFFSVYIAILFELNAFGGITVAIFVFIPTTLVSFFMDCLIVECCKILNKKYVFFAPAILALINTLILLILVNVVFRIVIVIV